MSVIGASTRTATPRALLSRSAWAELAAQPTPALIGLWADTVQVHALFEAADPSPTLVSVAVEAGRYPALSPARPRAALFERLVFDLWGHRAEGVALDPWLDHGTWPLRHPMAARPAPGVVVAADLPEATPGRHVLWQGPIRGGSLLHEPAALRIAGLGETVEQVEPRLGYAHKGTLLLMRGKSPRAAGRLIARLRGDATVAHSIAYARAAEEACQTTPSPRGEALRDVMAAIEAVAVHLGEAARICAALGRSSRYGRQRDVVLRATASAFGHRLMFDCVAPGGVAADLARGSETGLVAAMAEPEPAPSGVRDRLGPDGMARFERHRAGVRVNAARLRTLLADLPAGPPIAPLPPASGEGLGRADSAHGEVWHWLRLDGGLIANAFAIDPAWRAWPGFAADAAGRALDELAAAEAGFALAASGVDL